MTGSITLEGRDLLELPEAQMRGIRGAGIAMIFQEPMTALNPVMRVGDQVAEAVLAHEGEPHANGDGTTSRKITKQAAWQRAIEALRTVAIQTPNAAPVIILTSSPADSGSE